MEKIFLHADLGAFFASVEQLDHPEYRGKPVIVSGLPGDRRCVVSTASYEARKFGIHSAMPAKTAFQLCPNGIFVRPDMKRYHEKSHEVMSIFRQYSPDVIQMSVDEAFIDLTGTERLLGPAEETARRIKQQVKEETGLTISIGMASTMYLAKIASGYRKPDGLTIIKPGDEEKFMLSLPLNKLWGAGEKTLERLNKAGFRTTQQIYSKSEGLLQGIFGENTGTFLYNSVRGNKDLIFGQEAENHSISSEKTFEYDLTDRDAIETALLQLSHTVMFRLHRENVHSRTLALKIRYDDFTTVSIQQTSDRNISSVDDLFERCCKLFYRKYNKESGIRLLGVSADKVEDNSVPSQKELFDFGEEKKSKIEKTIMNLEDKMPGVKIQKARTLHKSLLFIPLALFLAANVSPVHAEDMIDANENAEIEDEEIVFFREKNNLFELRAKGFWEAEINTGTGSTFGYGKPFSTSFITPVFTQKADLTLTAEFSRHFYFEGKFADSFDKNTIAAVYKSDGFLKELRIANRGIVFPGIYSVTNTGYSIGGGSNLAPGIHAHFENEKIISDAVIRYEMLSQKNKTFYGKQSVTSLQIEPQDYIRGKVFVLASENHILDIESIYVENPEGTYSDSNGRKYKRLSSSEYLLNAAKKTITFTQEAGTYYESNNLPAVIVTFKTISKSLISAELGADTSIWSGDTFLGKIQDYFNSSLVGPEKIELSSYTFDLFTQIEGKDALVIQKGAYFSPFAVCCKYDAGYALSSDAVVINRHSNTQAGNYTVSTTTDDDSHLFLTVKNTDTDDYTLPEYRYPFASEEKAYYLNGIVSRDFAVEARVYSEVANYYIGTNAAEGSVSVYINELPDEGASYSAETGIVTPSRKINSQDKVYITWSEDNASSSYGSVAFGAAVKYMFTERFSSDVSVTGRWSLPGSNSYASSADSYPGFAALTAGVKYSSGSFYTENTFTSSIENENTSGTYRLLSMDDNSEKQNYLSEDSAVNIPRDKDISLNDRFNQSPQILLKSKYNCSSDVSKIVTDSEINGYAVSLEWDFSALNGIDSEDYAWAAKTIDLGSYADELCTGNQFSMALYSPLFSEGTKIYLQLGVDTNENTFTEDINSVPTWCLSRNENGQNENGVIYGFSADGSSFAKPLSEKWQQITVQLTDRDRARLIENKGARIIAVKNISSLNDVTSSKGTIYAGPWSVTGASFAADYDSSCITVRSFQYDRTAAEGILPDDETISNFNRGTENSVQSFRWNTVSPGEDFSDGRNLISFKKYFDSVSIDSYRNINFYFRYNPLASETSPSAQFTDDSLITVNIYSGKDDYAIPAVHLEITSLLAESIKGNDWHKVQLSLKDNTLYIDGNKAQPDSYILSVNTYDSVSSIDIVLNILSKNSGLIYKSGIFEIDELYLSETDTRIANRDVFRAGYVNKDNPLVVNGKMILGNIDFAVDASGVASKKFSSGESSDLSAKGSVKLNFDSLNLSYGINTEVNYSSNQIQNATVTENTKDITGLSLFNYSVKTKSPFLKVIGFSTDFTSNVISASDSASSAIDISLSQIKIPVQIRFSTTGNNSLWSVTQNASSSINLTTKHYLFSAQAAFSQKAPSVYSYTSLDRSFVSIQKNAFSTGRHDASLRNESLSVKNTFSFADGKIKPSFTVKADSVKEQSFNDAFSAIFELPVAIGSQTLSFGAGRISSAENQNILIPEKKSAYAGDIAFAFENIGRRQWFWKTLPVFDLFAKSFESTGTNLTEKNNSSYYLSWSKPVSYTFRDLFIPNGASVSFERETVSSTSVSDYYILKLQTLFSALNVFGKYGSNSLFNWYEQDYFSTILTGTVKIPEDKPESFTPGFNINVDDSFYLPYDGILELTFDTYYEKKNNLSINTFITWKRKAESSPLILLIALFSDRIKPSSIPLTRKNILSYQFSKTQDNSITNTKIYSLHKASVSNSLEAQINKYFTLTTTAACSYTLSENENMYCSILFALGGKLNF